MDVPSERVPESPFEATLVYESSPLDPNEALDLHRAINERRAQLENPELLRRLRSL